MKTGLHLIFGDVASCKKRSATLHEDRTISVECNNNTFRWPLSSIGGGFTMWSRPHLSAGWTKGKYHTLAIENRMIRGYGVRGPNRELVCHIDPHPTFPTVSWFIKSPSRRPPTPPRMP